MVQFKDAAGNALAVVAIVAATLAALKAASVGIGVPGNVEAWCYVAVACAAAKLAR